MIRQNQLTDLLEMIEMKIGIDILYTNLTTQGFNCICNRINVVDDAGCFEKDDILFFYFTSNISFSCDMCTRSVDTFYWMR